MHGPQIEETEDMEGLQGFEDVLVRNLPGCIQSTERCTSAPLQGDHVALSA